MKTWLSCMELVFLHSVRDAFTTDAELCYATGLERFGERVANWISQVLVSVGARNDCSLKPGGVFVYLVAWISNPQDFQMRGSLSWICRP